MPSIQDTIAFAVSADETVVNDTVKITAMISGIVPSTMSEKTVKDSLRDKLNKFLPEAKWHFGGMNRNSHASGMEEISVSATTRVNERMNVALERRSKEVSTEGMSIVSIHTDTSPTANQIEAAEGRLRITLLDKAQAQRSAINEKLDAKYRLGNVMFQAAQDTTHTRNNPKVFAMSASASNTASYGSDLEDEAIGNAVKLTMMASITLTTLVKC